MEKFRTKWGIRSNFQIIIIFIVFALTGSASVLIAKPILNLLGLNLVHFPDTWWRDYLYWSLRLLIVFPIYQVLLVIIGWGFGQFAFFWNLEKKMLRRMGLGFLLRPADT